MLRPHTHALIALSVLAQFAGLGCVVPARPREIPTLGGQRQFYGAGGTVLAIGTHSRFESDEFEAAEREGRQLPRWREFLRVGSWEFRHPQGRIQARLTFAIGWYTDCCAGGPCDQPYEYRVGAVEAWWPSGALLAKGRFHSVREPIATNCEGGDEVQRGVLSDDTRYWNEDGSVADRGVLERAGVDLERL